MLRLVLLAVVAAPVIFPDQVQKLFGIVSNDPSFETRYSDGLRHLLTHLSQATEQ